MRGPKVNPVAAVCDENTWYHVGLVYDRASGELRDVPSSATENLRGGRA